MNAAPWGTERQIGSGGRGRRDTDVDEVILKQLLLVESGDTERVLGGLNPRQI